MIANDNASAQTPADDNVIQPFQLETSGLRGRVVRLGSVLNDILSAHDYPQPVAHLLAESTVMTLLLGSMLKYDGIFTLQLSGDAVVKTLVSDITSAGALRGYAGFDATIMDAMIHAEKGHEFGTYNGFDLAQMMGKGYLVFTVDQGENTERYQGIVELRGATIAKTVEHYFKQSEQIQTTVRVAVSYDAKGGWRAGGIIAQRMPDAGEHVRDAIPINKNDIEEQQENWNRTETLLQSVRDDELTNVNLHSHELLLRLFHEEGVRIFDAQPVFKQCRCSLERVQNVLVTLSEDDREHAADKNGQIAMTCEFCSRTYKFNAVDLSYIDDETPPVN